MSEAFAIYSTVYKKANPFEKEFMMTKYEAHQARKDQTGQHQAIDKQRAIENPNSIKSIICDLQKAL